MFPATPNTLLRWKPNTDGMATLITGASSGIGLELARQFARNDHDVVLVARGEDRLMEVATGLEGEYGVDAEVVAKDLTAPDAPTEVYREVDERGITIDVLVNNAGIGTYGAFHETELEDELTLVKLNVLAVTHLTKLYIEDMVKRDDGRILNVASSAAFQPGPLMATYYASKAYVLSFTEAIAEELRGTGVSATALCPGPVDTGFQETADMEESGIAQNLTSPERVAEAGYSGVMRGKTVVIPSLKFRLLELVVRASPRSVVRRVTKRLNSPTS